MSNKTIYIGSDHAGFKMKSAFLKTLKEKNIEFVDLGTQSEESCHYPEFASAVAKKVSAENAKGLLVCGSGIGVSMVANRYKGVRAALCRTVEEAKLSRQHNNSNVLCLGERITEQNLAEEIFEAWLTTEFEGGRHQNRIDLFDQLGE